MKFILLIVSIFLNFCTLGQMVNASLFGEMKALNPAVISERKSGQMTAIVSKLDAKKTNEIDDEENVVQIDITDFNFFRGGKGGGTTTEFTLRKSSGTSVRTVDSKEEKTDADLTYANLGVSFGSFGISGFYNKFIYESDEATEQSLDQTVTIMDLKAGIKFKYIALTVEAIRSSIILPEDEEESEGQVQEDEEPKASINLLFGAGIGFSSDSSHFEFSVETTPSTMESQNEDGTTKSVRPARISATAEFKVWGITLGYTGRAYMNGFEDPELIVNNRLIFFTPSDMRIEHNINFALGGSSGLSVSGGASLSESSQKEPKSAIDPRTLTYDTTTKLLILSAKVGYAW